MNAGIINAERMARGECRLPDSVEGCINHAQTRGNLLSRPTHKVSVWDILDEFTTVDCMDGHVFEHIHANKNRTRAHEFFEKLLIGGLVCGCVAQATWLRTRYQRHAVGIPKNELLGVTR